MLLNYYSLLNWPTIDRVVATEKDGGYVLEIELPRYKKENIDIEVDTGQLFVKAKKGDNSYSYSTTIPKDVDTENITSTLEDGVLTISLNRSKKVKTAKKIAVN